MKITIFWFKRDLRLLDNRGLLAALESPYPVLPIFIFDENILEELPQNDARVTFIYQSLEQMQQQLVAQKKSLLIQKGRPLKVWKKLIEAYDIQDVYTNKDYEPYALNRDNAIAELLSKNNIKFHRIKDQVIFEENEILKQDKKPYTVYTPYKNKWLTLFDAAENRAIDTINFDNFYKANFQFPTLQELGFERSFIQVKPYTLEQVDSYHLLRDLPSKDGTSYLSPHLRFGTVSVRQLIAATADKSAVFLSELIWREFFMQILFHFPKVVHHSFKSAYDCIEWRNNETEFNLWCQGKTGYPLVDAGMRQLNETGYMHNRVRMVVASFLCKHLLIDWRWGEAYFAQKLLDYDLSANNGNWQWAAGTGCDAAPYFRVFNPTLQQEKFDKQYLYIKKWVTEYGTADYSAPMVEHKMARLRALATYKAGLENAVVS